MQKIASYPLLFLGTAPSDAIAIYSIMSHVDFKQGVRYPQGGLYEIIRALVKIAQKHGVEIHTSSPVSAINVEGKRTTGITLSSGDIVAADIVISNADMPFTETRLLASEHQTYPASYREKKTIAPSSFILYLGIDGKLPMLTHHNLIFTKDRDKNFAEIFKTPVLPTDPSLYICKPSEVDPSVAPVGKENMFILVPCAPGLTITPEQEIAYTKKIIDMIADVCHIPDLASRIEVSTLFHNSDFTERYNAYKGTALGLAHTLLQTAVLRPNNYSKKVKGLYYTGAFTNPGIGTQMCLIAGQLTAERILS
jgi:phytoene desaturase